VSIEHIVLAGEHLAGIAAEHGFPSFLPIWNHPANADLKALRKNPNQLLAGDKLFIPDREVKQVDGAVDQRHRFVASGDTLELQVKIHDQGFQPLHGEATISSGDSTKPMSQSGDIFKAPLPRSAKDATLAFPVSPGLRQRPSIHVQPGRLDPLETLSGQQQRLNNLGYFAGFARTQASDPKQLDPQMLWAVQEFQCDHLGPAQADGVPGPITLKKLKEVYGC